MGDDILPDTVQRTSSNTHKLSIGQKIVTKAIALSDNSDTPSFWKVLGGLFMGSDAHAAEPDKKQSISSGYDVISRLFNPSTEHIVTLTPKPAKEHIVRPFGDTFYEIARDHGTTEGELLKVPGNEYLATQKIISDRGKEVIKLQPGQKVYIPAELKYSPQSWWMKSDYGSKIETTTGSYNFLSSFNQGNHESIYSFAKNVHQPFKAWSNGLGQNAAETMLAKRSMEIKMMAVKMFPEYKDRGPISGHREYLPQEYVKQEYKFSGGGKKYESYKLPDFSNSNKQYIPGESAIDIAQRIAFIQSHRPAHGNVGHHLHYAYSSGGGHSGGYRYTINFPLTIDLDNDGLQLISLDNSNVFYDIDEMGALKNIGWSSSKDAFLAIDLGDDHIISMGREISFKLWHEDAKTDLEGLRLVFDSNEDGKINADDKLFENLVVWQDANQNGVSEDGEIKSLAKSGIEEILLDEDADIHPDSQAEGNIILKAVKLKTDGRIKGAIYDIGLATSDAAIYSEENDDSIELFYGNKEKIKVMRSDEEMDLNQGNYTVAIGDDRSQIFIANNNENSVMDGYAGNDSFIGGDKNDWAKGGAGADSYLMGKCHDIMLIDSEDEKIDGGEDYDIVIVATKEAVILDMAKANVEAAYGNKGNDIFDATNSKVGVFIDGGQGDDTIEGSAYADVLIGGKGIDKIKAGAGDDVLSIDAEDDLSEVDAGDGEDTIFVIGTKGIKLFPDKINAEIIYASQYDDQIEHSGKNKVILFGNGGNDYLRGGDGDDYLDGGPDDDLLEGGFGSDRYAFYVGAGHDKIRNKQRDGDKDILLLYSSIKLENIIFRRNANDLILALVGNNKDSMTLVDWYEDDGYKMFQILYNVGTDNPQLLNLQSAKNMSLDIGDEEGAVVFTLDGDDKVSGGIRNDFISLGAGKDEGFGGDGDDIIAGGAGEGDYLRGWRGDDTYLYNIGDGNDIIHDNYQYTQREEKQDSVGKYHEDIIKEGDGGQNDRIKFGAPIRPTDLSFKRDNNDLIIDIIVRSGDSIIITNWFNAFNKIESLSFDNGDYKLGNHIKAVINDTIINSLGKEHIYTILEGLDNRSTRFFSSNAFVSGSSKRDYIIVNSASIVNAGDGDDDIFVNYATANKENQISGGNGRDGFILINKIKDNASYNNIIADFSQTDDYLEIRGFKDVNSKSDLKFTQKGDDVIITINPQAKVKILGVDVAHFNQSNLRFSYQDELQKPGDIKARVGENNHLFGSSGDDVLSGNNASFVNLVGGGGNDIIRTDGAKIATITEGPGNDVIECSANTTGKIRYAAGDLSKGNFGHDNIYCDLTKMKIEVDRQEQIAEMLTHLTQDQDGNAVFKFSNWSITLHNTGLQSIDASIFSIWEDT